MNENNPIAVLISEHDVISSAEKIIDSLDRLWENDAEIYSAKVKTLLSFFREYGDKFHHHKEEEVLFKELKSKPEFFLTDLVDELENHHSQFRELLNEVESKIDAQEWSKSFSLLNEYFQDLLDHISVENTELFSMVETTFDEDELTRIYFLFEDIDRDLGVDSKEHFVKLISDL